MNQIDDYFTSIYRKILNQNLDQRVKVARNQVNFFLMKISLFNNKTIYHNLASKHRKSSKKKRKKPNPNE